MYVPTQYAVGAASSVEVPANAPQAANATAQMLIEQQVSPGIDMNVAPRIYFMLPPYEQPSTTDFHREVL